MKKIFVFILISSFTVLLYSQDVFEDKEFARWSITGGAGINYFAADNMDFANYKFPSVADEFTYTGGVEYAFNPIWGMALNYYYLPMINTYPLNYDLNNRSHSGELAATVNLIRLIYPLTKTKFYINANFGLGLSYVSSYDITISSLAYNELSTQEKTFAYFPFALSVEYNLSKNFAIGIKGQLNAYVSDELEGVYKVADGQAYKGVSNDMVEVGLLYLRYKFTSSKKKENLRNITMLEFGSEEVLAKQALAEIAALRKRVDTIETRVDTLENKVDYMLPRIDKLEQILSNEGPDEDEDGVPDVRDLEPDTDAKNLVDFWGRTINLPEAGDTTIIINNNNNTTVQGGHIDLIPTVYFDFDSFDLDDAGLITISEVAQKMKTDPAMYVEIRGFCDYLGDVSYNERLSLQRSARVKQELIKVWGIPENKIIVNGKGKVSKPELKYRPNRRCELHLSK